MIPDLPVSSFQGLGAQYTSLPNSIHHFQQDITGSLLRFSLILLRDLQVEMYLHKSLFTALN